MNLGFTSDDLKKVIWTFIQAFVASLYVTATGWSSVPNLSTAKAAAVSAGIAALAAAVSFVKNFVLADTAPIK